MGNKPRKLAPQPPEPAPPLKDPSLDPSLPSQPRDLQNLVISSQKVFALRDCVVIYGVLGAGNIKCKNSGRSIEN